MSTSLDPKEVPPPENSLPPPPVSPVRWEPATRFYRQLHMTAMGLLILVLVVFLLQTFALVLQQLLIATFVVYLILPVPRWFVQHGVSSFWLLC